MVTDATEGRERSTALRRCTLAVSVIHEVDMVPTDDGIVLVGVPDIAVSLAQVAEAIGDADPADPVAQDRLYRWLRARRAIANKSLDELAETIRPVALPVGHALHPGPRWVRQPVLGGSLDLGHRFRGLAP